MPDEVPLPLPRSVASRVASVCLVVMGGLFWLPGPIMVMAVAPKFKEIFEKFDIKGGLPPLTEALLSFADFMARVWCGAGALWVLVVGGLAVGVGLARSRCWLPVSGVLAGISLLAMLAMLIVLGVTVSLPLMQLIQSVGSRR